MPGRYRFVAALRKRMQLYKLSNTIAHRNPFRYLFGANKHNPYKISHDQHLDEMRRGQQAPILSYQWHDRGLQNRWIKLKNLWFDARTSGSSSSNHSQFNDIDSEYLNKNLLKDMDDDDVIKSKWIKFTKKKLLKLGNASMNNKIDIYHRGEFFFESLWKDIKNAEEQILMETYIMEPDKIAIKTIKLLTDASLRGVSVTLIIDSFGSSSMNIDTNEYLNELKRAGAVVLEYNKVKVSRFFEFMFLKQEIPFIFAYRNHKKIIVIDDKWGYTGGMNISGEYCGLDIDGGINKFRDTHCKLQGDIVRYLKESLYFSVLDINPSLPPPKYQYHEEDDDTDDDVDTDDEIEEDTEDKLQQIQARDVDESDIEDEDERFLNEKHRQNVIKHKGKIDVEEMNEYEVYQDSVVEREKINKDDVVNTTSYGQRLFPYHMLPGFLKNFNAYRKRNNGKKLQDQEVSFDEETNKSIQDHQAHHEFQPIVSKEGELADTENEDVLVGRKKRWHESWKQMQRDRKRKRNPHEDTYKNRLKILASSPRKSLSEWIKYYDKRQAQDDTKKDNQQDLYIRTEMERVKTQTPASQLEVSALSKLMDEANKTKNFSYPYSNNKDRDKDKNEDIEELDNLYIQVLESYRDKRFRLIQKALMNAIDNAVSHIFIMNPYFLPPVKLKKRLRKASERGVDVRVITCDQSDVPFISMASRHIYEDLLDKDNIRLFEYEGTGNDSNECADILHGKMCLIDDVFVSLGSFNWDDWSYTKNLEMNLMIVDNKVAKSIHEQFVIDQRRSKEVKLENVKNDRNIFQKTLYFGAYLVSRIANRMF